MQNINNKQNCAWWGECGRGKGRIRGCCTFHTISCEPQTALKKKIYLLKRKVSIKKKKERASYWEDLISYYK